MLLDQANGLRLALCSINPEQPANLARRARQAPPLALVSAKLGQMLQVQRSRKRIFAQRRADPRRPEASGSASLELGRTKILPHVARWIFIETGRMHTQPA